MASRCSRSEGVLVLIVPHRDGTFDHRRPVTPMDHLIEDFDRNVGEDDLTHLDEILELHDLAMDREAGDFDAFRERSLKNVENRGLHHHVFDTRLAIDVTQLHGVADTGRLRCFRPYNILIVAQKPKERDEHRQLRIQRRSIGSCSAKPFRHESALPEFGVESRIQGGFEISWRAILLRLREVRFPVT